MTPLQQKIWDVKPPKWWRYSNTKAQNRRAIRRFFNNLQTREGTISGRIVKFVYVDEAPELSYIISEDI